MKFTEIVAAIEASELDKKAEIIKGLNDYIKSINDDKQTQYDTLTSEIESVLEAAQTGEGNLQQKVKNLVNSVKELQAQLETTETKLTEKETAYQQLERSSTIKEAARMVGLNSDAALSEILKPEQQLEIKDNKVLIDGKEYKTWVEQDKTAFAASLLPTPASNSLPSGGANPSNQNPTTPSASQMYVASHTWGGK